MISIHSLQNRGKKSAAEFRSLLFLGVFNIILGALAVAFVLISSFLTMIFLGWLLILNGLATIRFAFHYKRTKGHWSLFIFAGVAILCGILILINPISDALALSVVLSAFIFSLAVVSLISCALAEFDHKGWVVFSSLVAIASTVLVYVDWPASGIWMPGTFFGVYLLFHGMTQVRIGMVGRRFLRDKTLVKPARRRRLLSRPSPTF